MTSRSDARELCFSLCLWVADMAIERSRWVCASISATLGLSAVLLLAAGPARAADFPLAPQATAVGAVESYVAEPGDTLMDIGRRHDLGFTQLTAVNRGVNPWAPGVGRRISIPNFYLLPDAPHRGIVVNLAEQRLYYFPPGKDLVQTFPIGLGVLGAATPLGTTRIVAKLTAPPWYPPPSIHAERPELPAVIPPGPDNPLGAYAFRLGWPTVLIHGTNKPDGVGRDVSHGCMHLYPEDIESLFHEVPVGTPVRVVDQDVKAAWVGHDLYLEIHPTKEQGDELDIDQTLPPASPPDDLAARMQQAAGGGADRIDWAAVRKVASERTGVPTIVSKPEASDHLVQSEPTAEFQ